MSQMFNLFRVSSRALLVANNSSGGSLQRYAVPAIQRFSHSSASSSPYISQHFYSDAYTSQLDRGASRAGQTVTQNKDQQQDNSSSPSSSVHFHGSDQQSQASTKPLGATLSGSNAGMQGQYNKDDVFSKIRGAETDDLSSDKNKKEFSSSSSSSSKSRQSQTRQFNEDENKDKDKDEKEDYDSDDDDRVKDVDKRRTHQFSEFNKNQSKNDWKMQQGGDKSSSFNSNSNKDFKQNNKNQQQSDEFYHSQIDAFNKEKSYSKNANYSGENPQSTKTYGSSSDRSQKYEGDRMSPSSSSSSSSSAGMNYSSSDSPFTATYVGGDSSFQSDSSQDMDKSKKNSSSSSNSSGSNRSSGDKKKDVEYYDTAQGIFQKDKEFIGNNRLDTNYGSDRMQQKQQQSSSSSSSSRSSSSSFDSSDLPSGMGMTRKDMESQDPVHSAKERQQNAFHKEEDRSALKGDIGGAGGNFGSSSVVSSSVASKEAEQKKEFKKDQKMDSDKDRDRDSKNKDKDRDRDSNKDYKKQSDKKEFDQSSNQQSAKSRQQPTHDLNEQLNDATIPHSQHSRDNQWRGP